VSTTDTGIAMLACVIELAQASISLALGATGRHPSDSWSKSKITNPQPRPSVPEARRASSRSNEWRR